MHISISLFHSVCCQFHHEHGELNSGRQRHKSKEGYKTYLHCNNDENIDREEALVKRALVRKGDILHLTSTWSVAVTTDHDADMYVVAFCIICTYMTYAVIVAIAVCDVFSRPSPGLSARSVYEA